jgi:hypothetical protein
MNAKMRREQRDRETERQRDRETERQRDRETERQRDREGKIGKNFVTGLLYFSWYKILKREKIFHITVKYTKWPQN